MVSDDRGQAFTLEGVVAALLLVLALLLALQAQVITPTTGGTVDTETRQQLQQSADDALFVAATMSDGLSWLVRHYDPVYQSFTGPNRTTRTTLPGALGEVLNRSVVQRGKSYALSIRYRTASGTNTTEIVQPPEQIPLGAVTASHTVTLYDNQTLTTPGGGDRELWEYVEPPDSRAYPVPNAVDGPVYNVVEVEVTVW